MARDIASVADKDTREDDGTHGEVLLPSDAPRTEGGPAARESDPVSEGTALPPVLPETPESPETPTPDDAIAGEVSPQPPVPDETAFDERLPVEPGEAFVEAEPVEPEPEPVSAEDHVAVEATPLPLPVAIDEPALDAPHEGPVEAPFVETLPIIVTADDVADVVDVETPIASDVESWRSAIADALGDPPDVAPPAVAPPVPIEQADPFEAENRPSESHVEPKLADFRTGEAWEGDSAPKLTIDAPMPPAEPSFTAVAEDLFRPPAIEEEPHLITLGRRLDPTLRIPRPQAPDIQPRSEPRIEPLVESAEPGGKLWSKAWSWWKAASWPERLRTIGRYAAYALGGYLALVVVLILLFRFVNPPGSMLMLTQLLTGTSINRTWAPLASISPHLVRAVVVSEDGRFCEHSGIDTAAIKEAIDRAARGTPGGASTISMQVTKNLFLWNAKSYVRKVIEIPLTLVMELVWPKWRILEVYLNIAEWGPGVFGAEAAARHHFNKSAARLSEREAALLASVLPNPVVRDAASPSQRTSAKARVVQSRVRAYGAVASCVISHAAAAPARTTAPAAVRPRTIRKAAPPKQTPPKPAPPKKQEKVDDWAPSLDFGR